MTGPQAERVGGDPSQQTVISAARDFARVVQANTWVRSVARLDEETSLSRLNCFVGRRWLSIANRLDSTLGELVRGVLDDLPAVPDSDPRSWRYVDETRLLRLSQSALTAVPDRVRLWVATMIWGRALDNRGPGIVARALGSHTVDGVAERLTVSFNLVRRGDLAAAYAACLQGGPGSFATIGPPFFTKWLWSAGLSLADGQVRPLILDTKVLTAREGIDSWVLHGPTPGERWAYYCALVAAVAQVLRTTFMGINAEKIEYALFCLGSQRPN